MPSAWDTAEPRARLVLVERDLGAARHVPLASPLVQEEGRRRLGAPPSRKLGWCLQGATWGRLAMFLSYRRELMKKGAVGLKLAGHALGAARYAPLASPMVQEEGRRRLGAAPSRGLGWCLQGAI